MVVVEEEMGSTPLVQTEAIAGCCAPLMHTIRWECLSTNISSTGISISSRKGSKVSLARTRTEATASPRHLIWTTVRVWCW